MLNRNLMTEVAVTQEGMDIDVPAGEEHEMQPQHQPQPAAAAAAAAAIQHACYCCLIPSIITRYLSVNLQFQPNPPNLFPNPLHTAVPAIPTPIFSPTPAFRLVG
ncbi:hypothetical protein PAPYR_10724 [Paratrimastix pyriformis]|uniref:Uncharacterized protein n=1 Tax=Paratrimastix pyriformis TaxID=342808 RepID=A0ABQ8U5B3_9EUKA|nr:hypothetical protein PAPYR_10724 [Paratrimastix pyriformis]